MLLSISNDLSTITNFMFHTPFAMYALIATLLIFIAYIICIYLDEIYLRLLLPITYVILLGFGTFYYWDKIIDVIKLVGNDFSIHGVVPYVIGLCIMMFITFGSLFFKKVTTYSKLLHITSFSLLQLLFFVFAYVIETVIPMFQSLDKIYQNELIVAVLNISVWVIIIWFGLLMIGFLTKMIYDLSSRQGEDDFNDTSINTWNDIEYDLKRNIVRLEKEIDHLKEQSEQDRMLMLEKFETIEETLSKTNEFFLSQIEEVAEHTNNDQAFHYIKELQNIIEENYNIITTELYNLKGKPDTEIKVLKSKLEGLETMVLDTNEKIVQQLELLKVTPEYEIEKMKDEMTQLEILLKRYMEDMNHEIMQTKKEFDISKSKKRRQYYENIK